MIKVPTFIPPAVLSEPPPMNMSSIISKELLLVIAPVSIVLNPEERGTVA